MPLSKRGIRLTEAQYQRFVAIAPKDKDARRKFVDHFIESCLSTAEMLSQITNFIDPSSLTTADPKTVEESKTMIKPSKEEVRENVKQLIDTRLLTVENTDEIIAQLDTILALAGVVKK